jgi:transcriptional regulator with XRE-family HTH domain
MADMSETLRNDLRDPEFAEGYAESFLDSYIATQIKVLREQNELTQTELAALLGTTQTVISRAENVNYSSWNIRTLKKIARALKVRLKVSFETYGSLIDEAQRFSRESLQRVPRDKDPALWRERRRTRFRRMGHRVDRPFLVNRSVASSIASAVEKSDVNVESDIPRKQAQSANAGLGGAWTARGKGQ